MILILLIVIAWLVYRNSKKRRAELEARLQSLEQKPAADVKTAA